jgi:predicted alpha/beta superfamily hydrolase
MTDLVVEQSKRGIQMEINRRATMGALAATATTSVLGLGTKAMAATGHSPVIPARSPVVRPDAEQWDMTSKITGRTYRIFVARPAANTLPPPGGYPVVYVTDGDFTFHTAADAMTLLGASFEARPAIIVGIGYGKDMATVAVTRFADLTPTPPEAASAAAIAALPAYKGVTFGEADRFYRFLTEELRPQIDAAYKTDKNNNILWGHSLGGLFGLHVLFNHPEAYRTYLIGSPSIVWNGLAILKDETRLTAPLAAGKVAPRVIFTVGELEEKVADDATLRPGVTREQLQARLKSAAMVTNVIALADRLKGLKAPAGYKVEAVVFDGETHISVLPATISRGLRFALNP